MRAAQAQTVPTRFRFCGMKNVLILGYGKEGIATEAYVRKHSPELEIRIADALQDKNYLDRQDECDIAVKTPGIPKSNVRAQYTTATNIFFSACKNPIVGITGSKGKSTTASLVERMLEGAGIPVQLAGNIGTPMLELLMKGLDPQAVVVLELSSYQLDDIEFSPHIAVVTNLFPEHMDYHGSVSAYYDAKKNILRFQKPDDVFMFDPAVSTLREWAQDARARAVPFVDLPFETDAISLLGEHNLSNVRAAATVAGTFGVTPVQMEKAVREFKGLPHRLELVGEFKGIRFYDDAISTAPESTIAALRAVPNVGTIFLGGHDRGYDFSELEKEVRSLGMKNIVLFPESGKKMFKSRAGMNVLETTDMKEAVAFAYKNTPQGFACLLSCASPSYGLWKNFEERGNEFAEAVRNFRG